MHSCIRTRLDHSDRSAMIKCSHLSDKQQSLRMLYRRINRILRPPKSMIVIHLQGCKLQFHLRRCQTQQQLRGWRSPLYVKAPTSHRELHPTPCRAVALYTPHHMVRRSATQQNLSSDMLAEPVQKANHVLSFHTGPAIQTAKSATENAPVIIMSEMTDAFICPDTGRYLKHQKLITLLIYKIRWMRSTANEIRRLYKANTIRFIRKSDVPKGRNVT
jgi:hypothetical protein